MNGRRTTLRYDGPSHEAELASRRARGYGLPVTDLVVEGDRASFTVELPATLPWVQALSLAEVVACTRSPFDRVDNGPAPALVAV